MRIFVSIGTPWSGNKTLFSILTVPIPGAQFASYPTLYLDQSTSNSVSGTLFYAYSWKWLTPPRTTWRGIRSRFPDETCPIVIPPTTRSPRERMPSDLVASCSPHRAVHQVSHPRGGGSGWLARPPLQIRSLPESGLNPMRKPGGVDQTSPGPDAWAQTARRPRPP